MSGNGKVFISHAHEDNDRCAPLLAALDAWGVDYWFDTQRLDAGHDLSERIQHAIAERDIFIKICTPAGQTSFWVKQETGAFRALQAKDHKDGHPGRRMLIPLLLEPGYTLEPMEMASVYIDTTGKAQRAWLDELRRALGVALVQAGSIEPQREMLRIDGLEDWFTQIESNGWLSRKTGKIIKGRMLAIYRTMPAMGTLHGFTALGLPIQDEHIVVSGIIVQVFERGVLVIDPERMYDNPPGAEGDHYLAHIDLGWHVQLQG